MDDRCFGTVNLTNKCSKILFTHIKTLLPEIQKEITAKSKEIEERLNELGAPLPSSESEKSQILMQMVTEFITQFKQAVN